MSVAGGSEAIYTPVRVLPRMVDTVTRSSKFVSNPEMNAFGYLMAAILLVLLVPLLPFIVLLILVDRLRGTPEAAGE